ncbi:MAG TPA: hypothetical protein VGP06_11865 [Janthinobacterium sp.]|jgi:hypothetical protein|nr:hypothetical protein [Janthinobacterium sp.]
MKTAIDDLGEVNEQRGLSPAKQTVRESQISEPIYSPRIFAFGKS